MSKRNRKRKRCTAKVERGVDGTAVKVRCPKLAATGRKICRTHVAMKKKRERFGGDTRRRPERMRHEKQARANAHVLLRQRQKAARRTQKAKEPGTNPALNSNQQP